MKHLKKIVSLLLTAVMVLAMCIPVMAAEGSTTYTITIDNKASGHVYEAYQIFSGDLSGNVLSNIEWGSGVNNNEAKNMFGDAKAKAESLGSSSDKAAKFAKELVGDSKKTYLSQTMYKSVVDGNVYKISNLPAGYYLVKDTMPNATEDNKVDDFYSAYIMRVVDDVNVEPKGKKPTVDKEVLDEIDDAEIGNKNGWGESADHAINESFKFKLIATLPKDSSYADYPKYTVKFNDTMSKGVTFESIESVKINGIDITDYKCDATEGLTATGTDESASWSLTIEDVKIWGVDLTKADGIIEVIYKAHLNENATVNDANGSTDNKNTVDLEYSNNPNGSGMGKTAPDSVWVFTYKVDNTKWDATDANNKKKLAGAGFKLYDSKDKEVKLIKDDNLSAYRPVKGTETGVEMFSDENGKFNIVGLDAGTYTLRETTTPSGYNKCKDITVIINAKHVENSDGASANVTLEKDSTMKIDVDNKKGSSLPSTGGIGTTIFYVVGVILMLGAGVLLVTKKRMSSNR